MAAYITKIIKDFERRFSPQTLSSAENAFSRFVAGEKFLVVVRDFNWSIADMESVIRFFILYGKRNKSAVELYNNWQEKRFKTEDK